MVCFILMSVIYLLVEEIFIFLWLFWHYLKTKISLSWLIDLRQQALPVSARQNIKELISG